MYMGAPLKPSILNRLGRINGSRVLELEDKLGIVLTRSPNEKS